MADKNVQLKSTTGDNLYPKTKAEVVENSSGQNLGTVEAGAQVNKIETIKVNGVPLEIVSKSVDITASSSEYTIVKQQTAENGYSATYYLTKDGAQTGEKINIPKDMVVESGTVETCSVANQPVEGLAVGDKYIDLVIANSNGEHIYIPAEDLVDDYTAGTAITISGRTISVNLDTLKQTFAQKSEVTTQLNFKADKATTLAGYGITDAYTKTEVDNKIAGLNFITYEELA